MLNITMIDGDLHEVVENFDERFEEVLKYCPTLNEYVSLFKEIKSDEEIKLYFEPTEIGELAYNLEYDEGLFKKAEITDVFNDLKKVPAIKNYCKIEARIDAYDSKLEENTSLSIGDVFHSDIVSLVFAVAEDNIPEKEATLFDDFKRNAVLRKVTRDDIVIMKKNKAEEITGVPFDVLIEKFLRDNYGGDFIDSLYQYKDFFKRALIIETKMSSLQSSLSFVQGLELSLSRAGLSELDGSIQKTRARINELLTSLDRLSGSLTQNTLEKERQKEYLIKRCPSFEEIEYDLEYDPILSKDLSKDDFQEIIVTDYLSEKLFNWIRELYSL